MTGKYDAQVAVTVIGVAGFQLLQAWNANAPSLAEMRASHPHDISTRQKLMDADYLVGGLSVILGTAFAVLTHDTTALLVMLTIYGSVSFWYHSVLKAEAR